MDFLTKLFEFLNIPTNPKKVVGPSQLLNILGWSCRTKPTVQIGITEEKRLKYIEFIIFILKVNKINFKQSEKVVGYLRHTDKIYLLGNKFIRGIEAQKFELQYQVNHKFLHKFTPVKLTPEALFDLKIWLKLLQDLKLKFLDIDYILNPTSFPTVHVWTDASTSYGAGGCSSLNNVYHLPWDHLNLDSKSFFCTAFTKEWKEHIIYLELLALVIHAYLFGKYWKHNYVIFHCDNPTAVKAAKKGSIDFHSQLYYPKANLVKLLARLALKYEFYFNAEEILGDNNKNADHLSRKDDKLRNLVYNKMNKNHFIPSTIVTNILKNTCLNKFSDSSNLL